MKLEISLHAALGACLVSGLAIAAAADSVVAHVGDRTITAKAVVQRIEKTPAAHLQSLSEGSTGSPAKVVLDRLLIPELLGALEAERRGLEKTPRVADRVREILRQAADRAVRAETIAKEPATPAQIQEYFEANRSKYEQPLRIRIWRILVDSEDSAKKLIEEAKAANRPAKWSDLAREHSLDKATHMRQGDLGFVRADGSTDSPRVRAEPALFKAAETVKDGEIVAAPVPEAGKFAVIWRRGSLPPSKRTLAQESNAIKELLERQRVDAASDALIASLRKQYVKDEKPDLLDTLPDKLFGDKLPRPRPAVSVNLPPAMRKPEPGPDGNR
ncbi:MAG: peptidyl-prolyl cis-trans isomerase [Myxococcota bacterium]|nr:peptidyl-prolyl cis-trans isomerase [Myxococcota bacterium]